MSAAATDTGGQYVESVDVAGGTIIVTYSAAANSMIAGRLLALQPYTLEDNTVVWRCGAGVEPGPRRRADGPRRADGSRGDQYRA